MIKNISPLMGLYSKFYLIVLPSSSSGKSIIILSAHSAHMVIPPLMTVP